MWPFKRRQESPQEIAAEERLDEETREVADEELEKEAARESNIPSIIKPAAPLGSIGAMSPPLEGEPDPGDEHGLRDKLRDDEKS